MFPQAFQFLKDYAPYTGVDDEALDLTLQMDIALVNPISRALSQRLTVALAADTSWTTSNPLKKHLGSPAAAGKAG